MPDTLLLTIKYTVYGQVNNDMIMTLFIRKLTLNSTYNSGHLIDLSSLLSKDLSDEAFSALFDVFQEGQLFRDQRKFIMTRAETNNFRIHIPNESSTVGFSSIAFKEKAFLTDIVQQHTNYNDLVAKTRTLFECLGWTMSDLKCIEYEVGDYSSALANYTLYPMNYYTIEELYNQASPV